MTIAERTPLDELMRGWELPNGCGLLHRVDRMIRPAMLAGWFGTSHTRMVCGPQYHLGGEEDTAELAALAGIASTDHVLDACCFLGGPALQIACCRGCRVTGIDLNETCIEAANRLGELCDLSDRVRFSVADARDLPYPDGAFTVVWNQCSLEHDPEWLREFDRVLAPRGRMALTFSIRKQWVEEDSPRWSLEDVAAQLVDMGYEVCHSEDITDRDIEIGWKALIRKLRIHASDFETVLGRDWVETAESEFRGEMQRMLEGRWGNGRIVAVKRASGTL